MSDNELPDSAGEEKPPHLDESVRRIGAAGKATYTSAKDTGRALRTLMFADLALARSAIGRALAWVAVGLFIVISWVWTPAHAAGYPIGGYIYSRPPLTLCHCDAVIARCGGNSEALTAPAGCRARCRA